MSIALKTLMKTLQSTAILDSCLRLENSGREIRNAKIPKCFPTTLKDKAGVFKFIRFEERFRKAPFSRRISVDGKSSRNVTGV